MFVPYFYEGNVPLFLRRGPFLLEVSFPFVHRLLANKFYIDDFYQWVINNIILAFGRFIAVFDREIVNDTGVNGTGQFASIVGWVLRFTVSGKLPNYALGMSLGVAVLLIAGFVVKG